MNSDAGVAIRLFVNTRLINDSIHPVQELRKVERFCHRRLFWFSDNFCLKPVLYVKKQFSLFYS